MKIIRIPEIEERLNSYADAKSVFDPVRKKSVVATPEEVVRQLLLQYLLKEKKFPRSLLGVETSLTVNRLQKRCDIVAFKNNLPAMLIECKAPSVKIVQSVFDQVARYNLALKVPYLLVTNGVVSLCCKIDLGKSRFDFLKEIPGYWDL